MPTPLCFILMPFGKKRDATNREIDFDAVYELLIAPAVRAAGLEPLRAYEELDGGIIHKPIFEQLVLCEYAVADLTAANANVFYELGVRHAVKPHTTVLLFAEGSGQPPFDVAQLRAIPYVIDACGQPANELKYQALLSQRLQAARQPVHDSLLFQLLDSYPGVGHTKTDLFRNTIEYSKEMKERLAQARKAGLEAVRAVEAAIPNMADCEAGVVIDLFLSYRAVKGWNGMIALEAKMSKVLASTVMVREQLGFALNRAGRNDEAEAVLLELIKRRGPASETYGILGRVYKERWQAANAVDDPMLARDLLTKAIGAYLKGFEVDWRDAYPGINAVTLMAQAEPPDPRLGGLLPVVTYAVERKIASGQPDYWDYAARLELAVLVGDEARATQSLADALAHIRAPWEPETTSTNLGLYRKALERRGEDAKWLTDIEIALKKRGTE